MATTLDTLQVIVTGNVKGLQAAFTQASALSKKFATGVTASFNGIRAGFDKVASAAMRIVGPLAAAAAAFASVKSVVDAMQRTDQLGKVAGDLGLTTDALRRMEIVAQQSASSSEAMDKGLRELSRFLGEATEAGSEYEETLHELGLTLSDFAGMNAAQAFGKMSDALNNVEDGAKRAELSQKVLGRGARELAAVIGLGSEGIKEMGEEADRMGRVMSRMDFAAIQNANESMDTLGVTFAALSERIAVAFAPLIRWIADGLLEWIGNAKDFDSTFQGVARGIVYAIGAIRMTWQGLNLLWEMGKVAIGGVSVAFYEAANGIVYGLKWVGDIAAKTWDWIAASFNVTGKMLGVAWEWVKAKAISAFSDIGVEFGKIVRAIGETAAASRIKGLADIGRSAQDAGADLIVGAVRLKQGVNDQLNAAKDDLSASVLALEDARAAFSKPSQITTGLEDLVDQAHAFTAAAVDGVREVSAEIASQEGGDAIAATMADYEKSIEESQERITSIARAAGEERALISADLASQEDLLAQQSAERRAEWLKSTMERERAATEERQWLAEESNAVNAAMIAEQMRAFEEFQQTKVARENAYFLDLEQRTLGAKEKLALLELSEEERKAALIAEARTSYEEQNLRERMQWAEMWVSGMEGKLQVLGGILSGFASLMQSKNKSMFQVGKAAAMAETVINTFLSAQLAYTRALEIPGIGLGLAPIAAASAIAGGMMRLQQIASTQFGQSSVGGGAGGGAIAGGGMSGAADAKESAAASSQSNVNVTLYGQGFSSDQVRGLIGAINDQTGDNMTLKAQVM